MKENIKNLTEEIKTQTADLKTEYIETVKEWAKKEFAQIAEQVDKFRVARHSDHIYIAVPYAHFDEVYTNRHESQKARRSLENKLNAGAKIVMRGEETHIATMVKFAVESYESACAKLADRIIKKGLNTEAITIKKARVGVNIETTFTDGEKTVRAFTIIASGAVQKPHYRYLVK